MNQKIEWYREVLEIEPNSKVFFPLARILASDQQIDEAINTLLSGLSRHPYFIEARLLLVELLFAQNRHDSLWKEVDKVSELLGGYPLFWKAWAERLSLSENSKDAALAVTFVAAFLQKMPISWSDVIENGLMACFSKNGLTAPIRENLQSTQEKVGLEKIEVETPKKTKPHNPPVISGVHVRIEPVIKKEQVSTVETPPEPRNFSLDDIEAELANEAPEESDVENLPTFDASKIENAEPTETPDFQSDDDAEFETNELDLDDSCDACADDVEIESSESSLEPGLAEDDELEEVYSLRTRSMASILAEQGDFLGAREIYLELMSVAGNEAELVELKGLVEEMQKAHEAQLQGLSAKGLQNVNPEQQVTMNEHVFDKLKKLVDRLEVRAKN
ncbi:tetratricopeptide repeat protein [Desulfovibrio litoralis]|uniref:Tetratricopeptide repeat-containing protein n=1 Tax=Desulfovibrio litoralis DSM 11393 TaxID=1121455 RepID=A0A1M7THB5_9BACT|nr:hypothetical protein [Desulfovibrio litoralis]SHN70117.1 hypothetical protein SAMN02745728_02000 [Desulfovibrio litoralis DSM 11393]